MVAGLMKEFFINWKPDNQMRIILLKFDLFMLIL